MPDIQPSDVAQFAPNYYSAIRNPKWKNAEHTIADCEVNFLHVGFEEWSPFTAHVDDHMPYSKQIVEELAAGTWGAVEEYEAPVVFDESTLPPVLEQPSTTGSQTL